jgi:hypothetical protein
MLGSLDFVYVPSRDVASDLAYWVDRVGAEVVFAIERFDTRVAMLELGAGPGFVLAQHLEGEAPVFLYRVEDLEAEVDRLTHDGAAVSEPFGFPYGQAVEIHGPGPQRVAIYERNEAERGASLRGRRDF